LLNRKEIRSIAKDNLPPGYSIVPLRLFINERGLTKLVIAIARGKKQYDKRQSIKEREDKRAIDRMFKQ
jgi:SsrA-binding protein